MKFKTISDVHAWLDKVPMFKDRGMQAANFSLDTIRAFCGAMGNPQYAFDVIHVAGTNGKGTVCHMAASVLNQAGYRTGLYTSPHLKTYSERFQISGELIADELMLCFFQENESIFDRFKLSYFEISTALAFWAFREAGVEIAVIETGLGGRLDATNLVNPLVSVISSIGLDHTDILGKTIPEIAAEKAGIIKAERPVVIGKLPEEARITIEKKAAQCRSHVVDAMNLQPEWFNGGVELALPDGSGRKFFELSMVNSVNAINTAITVQTLHLIRNRYPVEELHLVSGLKKTGIKTGLLGRFERIAPNEEWYYDGAHNPEALKYTFETTRYISPDKPSILVFYLMRDKISPDLMELVSQFDELYYFSSGNSRAASFDEVCSYLPKLNRFSNDLWTSRFKSAVVIFSGSLYFYDHIISLIQDRGLLSSASIP